MESERVMMMIEKKREWKKSELEDDLEIENN